MKNHVFEPEMLYGTAIGDKLDLMVYFDDLFWRSAGTVGHESVYLDEDDTGQDDSVHSMDGIFLMYNPQKDIKNNSVRVTAEDIAPTILSLFGIHDGLSELDGRILQEVVF